MSRKSFIDFLNEAGSDNDLSRAFGEAVAKVAREAGYDVSAEDVLKNMTVSIAPDQQQAPEQKRGCGGCSGGCGCGGNCGCGGCSGQNPKP